MANQELTQEQKDFRLSDLTLNTQFIYWLGKAKCMWTLKECNVKYEELRDGGLTHSESFDKLKRVMFEQGLKIN